VGKYSRKVKTWGALPEFTEHRNKKGQVTARTTYFEGKAYTTRVPGARQRSASDRAAARRQDRAIRDLFTIGPGATTAIYAGSALILLIAGIGWVANLAAGALSGFWPILGSALGWMALATTIVSIPLLGVAVGRSILSRGVTFSAVASAIGQLPILFMMLFSSIVALIGLDRFDGSNSALLSWVAVFAIALTLFTVVSAIVFAFRYGKRWLWLAPAAIVFAVACAFFTPLGVAGAVLSAVVALARYNWRSLIES
jgi:hypothetical protein